MARPTHLTHRFAAADSLTVIGSAVEVEWIVGQLSIAVSCVRVNGNEHVIATLLGFCRDD